MARIAITAAGVAAGAVVGFFFPPAGVAAWSSLIGGAMAGASVGKVAASLIDPLHTQGPRLNDLSISSSANGTVIPFGYGTFKVSGNIIWAPGLIANAQCDKATGDEVVYNYYASFAAGFCQGPASVVRIWGDTQVIWDGGGPSFFPSKYFAVGSCIGYNCGVCGAFVDSQGNLIEAVWVGHGASFTVPGGATVFQLGINNNYQCMTAGGFPVEVACSGGQSLQVYVPSTALPWECVGAENAAYSFGDVGGTSPVIALQNLQAGQTVTVSAIVNPGGDGANYQGGEGEYLGQITSDANVTTTAEGYATGNKIQWYGPDGNTNDPTGSEETAPPASIYPSPDVFMGTEDQEPMSLIQESEGVENTPAFRGLCYAAWENFPLKNFGNRIPNIRAEIQFQTQLNYTSGVPTLIQMASATAGTGGSGSGVPTSVTLSLPNTPQEGNVLVFLISGYAGGAYYQTTTPQFSVDSSSPSGNIGSPIVDNAGACWRTVQAGDGNSWKFDISNNAGWLDFVVFEVLGAGALRVWGTGQAQPSQSLQLTSVAWGSASSCTVSGIVAHDGTGSDFYHFNQAPPVYPAEIGPGITNIETLNRTPNGHSSGFYASANAALPLTVDYTSTPGQAQACTVVIEGGATFVNAMPTGDLGDAVLDICLRCGLEESQVDTSRLLGMPVIGYVIGRASSGQQCLQPLATAYFFDAVEVDGKLTFIPRGQDPCFNIPEADLGLIEDKTEYQESFAQVQDLPRSVQINYADPAINWEQGKQSKQRSVKVVKTRSHVIYELPMALEGDTALQIAEKSLYLSYLERDTFDYSTWKAVYSMLVPTDIVTFTGRGVTRQMRIQKTSEGAGRAMHLTGVLDNPKLYLSQAQAGQSNPNAGGQAPVQVPMTLLLYDIPLLADSDANPSGTGYYYGVTAPIGFAGAQLYTSAEGTDFSTEGPSINGALTYGTALNALSAAGVGSPAAPFSPWVLDTANTLRVQLISSGSFANATQAQLTQEGQNFLLVGQEVIQFETAAQQSDGTWILSNLLRGRRGTEGYCSTHGASENVIVLGVPGLMHNAEPDALLGLMRYYRCVQNGSTLGATSSKDFTFTGQELRPYSPVAIGGSQDSSGNWTICWLRRTRFGGAYGTDGEALVDGMGGPLNEKIEQYQVDILGGSPSGVVRTLTVEQPTAVYPASLQQLDFGVVQGTITVNVYQMSAVVGRGFSGTATLPLITDATANLPDNGQFYINGD